MLSINLFLVFLLSSCTEKLYFISIYLFPQITVQTSTPDIKATPNTSWGSPKTAPHRAWPSSPHHKAPHHWTWSPRCIRQVRPCLGMINITINTDWSRIQWSVLIDLIRAVLFHWHTLAEKPQMGNEETRGLTPDHSPTGAGGSPEILPPGAGHSPWGDKFRGAGNEDK